MKPNWIELSVGLVCFILLSENAEVLRGLEAYTMPGVGGGEQWKECYLLAAGELASGFLRALWHIRLLAGRLHASPMQKITPNNIRNGEI